MKKIAVIAEHFDCEINPVLYEMLTMVNTINKGEKSGIEIFILGEILQESAQRFSAETGFDSIAVSIPFLEAYNGAVINKILQQLFCGKDYDYICAPHSTSGMDYIPALAVSLNACCITGVEDVLVDHDKTIIKRSMFGGKLSAEFLKPDGAVVMTVQSGAFPKYTPVSGKSGKVTMISCHQDAAGIQFTGSRVSPSIGAGLDKADVIISAGRGIGDKENFKLIEKLARMFPRAATGASRPICDFGWVPYTMQVGITGSTVAPKLYMACGISGASQHTAGMKNAQLIVAVNTDPSAPVFQIADICIVEDAVEFVCKFAERIKKGRKRSG